MVHISLGHDMSPPKRTNSHEISLQPCRLFANASVLEGWSCIQLKNWDEWNTLKAVVLVDFERLKLHKLPCFKKYLSLFQSIKLHRQPEQITLKATAVTKLWKIELA